MNTKWWKNHTVRRYTVTTVTFRKENTTYEELSIFGNIQPASGAIFRVQITGGEVDDFITFRTKVRLNIENEETGGKSDKVYYSGNWYTIKEEQDRADPSFPLAHYKYSCVKDRPLKNELS
jgi:hypothetical protein